MTSPLTAKERIKGAKRARRTYRMNLRGDLRAEIEHLETELAELRDTEAPSGPSLRLGEVSPSLVLARRIEGLQEKMGEEWLDFVLEQQPWHAWRAFKANNPPRDGDEYDQMVGVNFDKLTEEFMPRCVVEPELDAEDWEGIFDKCSPGDIRDMGAVAYTLHEQALDVPKSLSASVVIQQSAADSEPPSPSESASVASTAGSHSSSTSTTTSTAPSPEPPSSPESPSGTTQPDDEPRP